MQISADGCLLLRALEGERRRAYRDAANIWTIGVGHVIREHEHDSLISANLTTDEIQNILRADLEVFEAGILEACQDGGLIPTQTQFDGFVLLAFNIGLAGFKTSTVLRRFLARDDAGAASAFLLWNKITVDGKKIASRALEARRIAESRLFLHGYYDPTPYNSLDDADRMRAMLVPRNVPGKKPVVVPSESEARPTLKNSRTMKAGATGTAASGAVGAAATVGVISSVAEQTKKAADAAGAASKAVAEAGRNVSDASDVAGGFVSQFMSLSVWIYGVIGAGALVALFSFFAVRKARREDWQRGWR